MSRTSADQIVNGKLINGYDYDKQAWVLNGIYQDCGHTDQLRKEWGGECCAAHKLAGQKVA